MNGSTAFDMNTITKIPIKDYLSGHDIILTGTLHLHFARNFFYLVFRLFVLVTENPSSFFVRD